MTQTDRFNGLVGTLAVKAPCKVATTVDIILSGIHTIDGVILTADESPRQRVLVKDQINASENGIYDVNSGAWTRSPDFDGTKDVVQGTIITINEGNISAQYQYYITTPNPIMIGTTEISFSSWAAQGPQGYQGPQGNQGNQGYQGLEGSQGPTGLQGPQGVTGNQGSQGDIGSQGYQGYQGIEGAQGSQGNQGNQGNQGEIGSQGYQGNQGTQGYQGNMGISITWEGAYDSETVYDQGDGISFDDNLYVSLSGGNQGHQPDESPTYWDAFGGSQGPQGSQGAQGNQGVQGPQGNVGSQGETGSQGTQGYQGVQGQQGVIGPQGNVGSQGAMGSQGYQGSQGSQGAMGSQGYQGYQGALAGTKAKYITRSFGSGNGNVAYTGYGFQPSTLYLTFYDSKSYTYGTGHVDQSGNMHFVAMRLLTNVVFSSESHAAMIYCKSDYTAYYLVDLYSYDADGFTLTWTLTGSPETGNLYIKVLAFQ